MHEGLKKIEIASLWRYLINSCITISTLYYSNHPLLRFLAFIMESVPETIFQAVWSNNLAAAQRFLSDASLILKLQQQTDEFENSQTITQMAVQLGHFEIMKLLLQHFPKVDLSRLLAKAAQKFRMQIMKYLLDNYDIADKNLAFNTVCRSIHECLNEPIFLLGYFNVLKLLYRSGTVIRNFKPIAFNVRHTAEIKNQISTINSYFARKSQKKLSLRDICAKRFADAYKHRTQHWVYVNGEYVLLEARMIPANVLSKIHYYSYPTRLNINYQTFTN